LYQDGEDMRFFLTERTEQVQHHKGQISLPGGSWEQGEHLFETATRETEEEIGVPQTDIEIIGELTPLFVIVTGFMIHPFVGYLNYVPKLVPHPGEVFNDFSVSVDDLLNPQNLQTELWTIRDNPVDVPFFKFNEYKVWGATAMILSEFKQILESVE
jgi:8-oxo-dGTP pyrophosphatase MutT (NUDIX family)